MKHSYGLKQVMVFIALLWLSLSAFGQPASFTYQGRLTDSSMAANGSYDFQFALFDAATGGSQVGSTQTVTGVQVTGGVFTVQLDFGAAAFPGADRFLEISVKKPSDSSYTILNPRQRMTSAPYAIRSLSAAAADTAITATSAANADKLDNLDSSDFLQANTNAFIRSQTTQQTGDFNISGTGKANIFDAATQFNLGGARILSNPGTRNLFAGSNAGAANTTGRDNAFFGFNAGANNTTGVHNVFTGTYAGHINTTGYSNSFFGWSAGGYNTTGFDNTFIGVNTGSTNTTGSHITLLGSNANVGANNLINATAIGAGATVSQSNSVVLGSNANVGIGISAPTSKLHVVGTGAFVSSLALVGESSSDIGTWISLRNTTTGGRNWNIISTGSNNGEGAGKLIFNDQTGGGTRFLLDGTGATIVGTGKAGIFDATTQYNINGSRILSNPGTDNLFAGVNAGTANTTGFGNTFFGYDTGAANTTGVANSFFGRLAGSSNTTGFQNSFFGAHAGSMNTTGYRNSIFGMFSGNSTTTGYRNSFFGASAGSDNTEGSGNSFFGDSTGAENTTGIYNSFFGASAGFYTTTGGNNSFFGVGAGQNNQSGSYNTVIGYLANVGTGNLNYATAIGAYATVSTSNTIALGRSTGEDKVLVYAMLQVNTLGAAGAATLCRNASNEIASCSSSLRYKTNITPFNFGLNLVNQLRPISFDWRDGGVRDVGFGAEEVARINPLFVAFNTKGEVEGVKYDRLSVVFVNAFKEQQAQIEAQQKQNLDQQQRIEQLQNQINEQKLLIENLRKLVCSQNQSADLCQ